MRRNNANCAAGYHRASFQANYAKSCTAPGLSSRSDCLVNVSLVTNLNGILMDQLCSTRHLSTKLWLTRLRLGRSNSACCLTKIIYRIEASVARTYFLPLLCENFQDCYMIILTQRVLLSFRYPMVTVGLTNAHVRRSD